MSFSILVVAFAAQELLQAPLPNQKLAQPPRLSEEAAQLLEHLKTEIAAYDATLKSGEIVFSITISEPVSEPITPEKASELLEQLKVMQQDLTRGLPPKAVKHPLFEKTRHWHITYRFEDAREFYHVKERRKIKQNGMRNPEWQETYREFEINGTQLRIRENKGTGWTQLSPQKMPFKRVGGQFIVRTPLFEDEFHPRWWGWHPLGFKFSDIVRYFEPTDVQRIGVGKDSRYAVTLHSMNSNETRSHEIWLDPQKGYRATQILTHNKSLWVSLNRPASVVGGITEIPLPADTSETIDLTRYTYQLAQFEPGIWFPQTATLEKTLDNFLNQQFQAPTQKIKMQVHHAVFNIPIDDKDLHILTDE